MATCSLCFILYDEGRSKVFVSIMNSELKTLLLLKRVLGFKYFFRIENHLLVL